MKYIYSISISNTLSSCSAVFQRKTFPDVLIPVCCEGSPPGGCVRRYSKGHQCCLSLSLAHKPEPGLTCFQSHCYIYAVRHPTQTPAGSQATFTAMCYNCDWLCSAVCTWHTEVWLSSVQVKQLHWDLRHWQADLYHWISSFWVYRIQRQLISSGEQWVLIVLCEPSHLLHCVLDVSHSPEFYM